MTLGKSPDKGSNERDLSIVWHAMSAEDVFKKLETHQQSGLTKEEVARRLQQYGRNELKEKPRPTF